MAAASLIAYKAFLNLTPYEIRYKALKKVVAYTSVVCIAIFNGFGASVSLAALSALIFHGKSHPAILYSVVSLSAILGIFVLLYSIYYDHRNIKEVFNQEREINCFKRDVFDHVERILVLEKEIVNEAIYNCMLRNSEKGEAKNIIAMCNKDAIVHHLFCVEKSTWVKRTAIVLNRLFTIIIVGAAIEGMTVYNEILDSDIDDYTILQFTAAGVVLSVIGHIFYFMFARTSRIISQELDDTRESLVRMDKRYHSRFATLDFLRKLNYLYTYSNIAVEHTEHEERFTIFRSYVRESARLKLGHDEDKLERGMLFYLANYIYDKSERFKINQDCSLVIHRKIYPQCTISPHTVLNIDTSFRS